MQYFSLPSIFLSLLFLSLISSSDPSSVLSAITSLFHHSFVSAPLTALLHLHFLLLVLCPHRLPSLLYSHFYYCLICCLVYWLFFQDAQVDLVYLLVISPVSSSLLFHDFRLPSCLHCGLGGIFCSCVLSVCCLSSSHQN